MMIRNISRSRRPPSHVFEQVALTAALKKAGLGHVRFRDLWHTCATRLIEAGVDLVTVSEILGHSSIQMTMRYAHPTPENMRLAVENLGAILDPTHHRVETAPGLVVFARCATPAN